MPSQPLHNIIVVIDHAGAKVFRTRHARQGASAKEIAPDAPQQVLHHVNANAHDADREEKSPKYLAFFEQIAVACKLAERIVLIGHGHGQSNEAGHVATYLAAHHPKVSARVLPTLVADLSHTTDARLIELGHHALQAAALD